MPEFKTFKRNLGVLISSPNANVFYHADIQGQSLWQIEGVKSVYIYPRSEAFIKPRKRREDPAARDDRGHAL